MSRSAEPAAPRRPASSSSATSLATLAWKASGGTAAISVITTSATSTEYSAGDSTRASAIWKSAFRPFAANVATPMKSPEPRSARDAVGRCLTLVGVATPSFSVWRRLP